MSGLLLVKAIKVKHSIIFLPGRQKQSVVYLKNIYEVPLLELKLIYTLVKTKSVFPYIIVLFQNVTA